MSIVQMQGRVLCKSSQSTIENVDLKDFMGKYFYKDGDAFVAESLDKSTEDGVK
jgi:hypothetical protein